MTWNLTRPKPALPNSYFWTWDLSTNWVLDDPGVLNFGCHNKYLKKSETYEEDYRRLTDLAAGLGVKGIVIWGFLRDSHGGVEAAKHVAGYAASRGVAIMPGLGSNFYGGAYYEGEHAYNLETFIRNNPDAATKTKDGGIYEYMNHKAVCPTHPKFVEWIQEGTRWLVEEFDIGGMNIENGDFMICVCERCRQSKARWPGDAPEFFYHQAIGYKPVLEALKPQLKDKLITYATYTGFLLGGEKPEEGIITKNIDLTPYLHCQRPVIFDMLPDDAMAQWTITGMVKGKPLPLTAYLDDGAPDEVFNNPNWPAALQSPSTRSVGFLHQGSQWTGNRYEQVVSSIKEGCLRAYRAGFEGVSIHGEVSSRHIPWALNYLAFSHFIHWPEDTLREFGRKTLGEVLGSEKEGEVYTEILAHWDAGTLTDAQKEEAGKWAEEMNVRVAFGHDLDRWRFWNWLSFMVSGRYDRQTVGFY